jgi:hypothetical protein
VCVCLCDFGAGDGTQGLVHARLGRCCPTESQPQPTGYLKDSLVRRDEVHTAHLDLSV